jgi:hypothetical protein
MDSDALLGYVLRLMWRDLGSSEQEWERTPQSVGTVLLALQQQVRLMGIRFTADEQHLTALREQVAQVDDLKADTNILQVERSLWTFLRVEGVEPTNNAAERGLRRAVLWRHQSFGTQSESGSQLVGRILTAVASLRQQGRDVLEDLSGVCRSALSGEVYEGLLPRLSRTPT